MSKNTFKGTTTAAGGFTKATGEEGIDNGTADEVDELKAEMNRRFDTLEAKFDIVMRHIIGS